MSQGGDALHLNRVHILERVIQDTRGINHLPSEVFIIKVADEKRLGRKGIRLHIHISPGDFVDEGRFSDVGVAADEECTCVGVNIGKTGYVLSHLLKVRQGVFLSPHDRRHAVCKLRLHQVRKTGHRNSPTKSSFLQLLTPVQAVAEFQETDIIFSNLVDEMAGSAKLA